MIGTYSFNKLPINLINIFNITKTHINYLSGINDKFILQFNINLKKNKHENFIKCWKSKKFSTFYFDDNQNKNSIYNLQFKTDNNNNIKIERLRINNYYYYNNNYDTGYYEWNNKIITKDEYKMVKTSIFDYLINLSKENKDVHPNLERFYYELKDEGFIIENKCLDNPFYKEAIKPI